MAHLLAQFSEFASLLVHGPLVKAGALEVQFQAGMCYRETVETAQREARHIDTRVQAGVRPRSELLGEMQLSRV